MNSLFQQLQTQHQQQLPAKLNQSPSSINNSQIQFLKSILSSSNPEQALTNLASGNPLMQQAMNLYKSSGMSPKNFFYQFAHQKGIDPDQFINSLQ